MARGDWNSGGRDRETDGRPGNAGESISYAKIYDPRSESEFSNRPDTATQIRFASLEAQRALAEESTRGAAQAAQSRVHVFPTVGKFIIPPEDAKNTWAGHASLIKDKSQNLYFNPEKFQYFDKIIADRLQLPGLTDPTHPDYAKYEGLRNNLAVLRNDTIGIYLDDGSFDPGDEVHIPKIAGIAEAIADGLRNDNGLRRIFMQSLSRDVANVEATGAREIYKYLLSVQTKPAGKLEGLRSRFNDLLRIPNRAWGLPPIEDTPFSEAGLTAPPPLQKTCYTAEELAAICSSDNDKMVVLAESTAETASNLRSLDTLSAPARETSVEEARRILRFLRNLNPGEQDMETWIGAGSPQEQMAKQEALARLVEIYSGELHRATRARPEAFHNMVVADASEAAGAVAMGMSLHAANALPIGHHAIDDLDRAIDAMPASWDQRSLQPARRQLDALEAGLRHTLGADVSDRSPADRLVEMSERIRTTAKKLGRAEDMAPPARRESIELAREILRKLKNLKFSDRPIDELMQSGTAADRAELAHKIDEMVDSYQNILADAVRANPGILNDPRVKEANDAVGSFAHAISLMAAKEIPASMAAAQQISADVTQMPEDWKNLHDKTVNRLVSSMEGGLEQAVNDMAMQQQEQQRQDEEMAQDAIEASMAQLDHGRRRRRRRQRSGQSAGAQRKVDRDIRADDRLLGQGVFRDQRADAPSLAPQARAERPSVQLRPEDMAAVQALGGNLRNIGNEAASLTQPLTMSDVRPDDKIVPDDKTAAAFADRAREERQQNKGSRSGSSRNNPNNNRPTRS